MRRILLSMAFVATIATANAAYAVYSDAVLADNPVGYWQFSETLPDDTIVNSGTAGTALDGSAVILTEVQMNVPGIDGGSIDFPANNAHVEVLDPGGDHALDFGGGEAMTLECWINCPNGAPSLAYILGKGRTADRNAVDQNYGLRLEYGNTLSLLFRTDTNEWGKYSLADVPLADGEWHHIVFSNTWGSSYIGSGLADQKWYIDGVDMSASATYNEPAGFPAYDFAPMQTDSPFWIGSSQNYAAASFLGNIDEVAVYDTILSSERVQAHYAARGDITGGPDLPEIPEPGNFVYNGDFDVDVDPPYFPHGWTHSAVHGIPHEGLSPTGIAAGETAVYFPEETGGIWNSQLVASESEWEVGFLFAAEAPETDRTAHFSLGHDSRGIVAAAAQINFRVNPDGDLQLYDGLGAKAWTTIPGAEGIIDFSVDADENDSLADAGDTLNVYTIKIVGDYTTDPSYDVYLSGANDGTPVLIAEGMSWYQTAAPETGSALTFLAFFQNSTAATGASWLLDEVYLQTPGAGPEPLAGDLNGDGAVNSGDLDLVRGNWGSTVEPNSSGDANGDGYVNSADLDIVRGNWGATAGAAVPEPGTCLLMLLAAFALAVRRK